MTELPRNLSDFTNVAGFPPIQPSVPERTVGERRKYRTIWISDVHLGTKGCNAELLIDFLDHTDSETMYLVGDIIDGWRLKKKFYWPPEHNDIVWRILKRARRGTRIVYIPGNHDEMVRPFSGMNRSTTPTSAARSRIKPRSTAARGSRRTPGAPLQD